MYFRNGENLYLWRSFFVGGGGGGRTWQILGVWAVVEKSVKKSEKV